MRFNSRFGETFTVPEAHILKETAKIYDLQNPTAKMSKSNEPKGTINIMDDSSVTVKKIKGSVTDADSEIRFDAENKAGVSNLLGIYSAVSGKSIKDLEAAFAGKGYGDLKGEVADAVISVIEPIRQRASELLENTDELDRLLDSGSSRANELAEATLASVYDKIGFIPRS
jgi:tryptophanyl-tRNA synthetase